MLDRYEELKGAKAGVYNRKSQESDEKQILSLGKQLESNDKTVAEYQFNTSPERTFEEKKSAKIAGQRPGFDRMIKMILEGSIEVIVAWQFSRFARNMQEGGLLIDLLHTGYLKAIVVKEKIFLPNDNTIIVALEAAIATEYSRDLSRNVTEGIDKKAALQMPHGIAPIGYVNNKHKRQGERDWSDDEERLPLVRQVMHKLLTGNYSASNVLEWAREDLKLTTPKREKLGGNLISRASFYRMLKKTEYAGYYLRNGEKITIKGITPIITEDEYWQIQDYLGREGVPRPKHQISTYCQYLFSPEDEYCGVDRTFRVTCDCSHKFSGRSKKECPKCNIPLDRLRSPRYYNAKHYYNVARKRRGEPCKYLNEKNIDAFFVQYVHEHLSMPSPFVQWSNIYLRMLSDSEYEQEKEKVKSQQDYLRSLEQQKRNAKQALLSGAFDPREYKETLREIERQEQKVTGGPQSTQWFEKATRLTTFSDDIEYLWQDGHGSLQEKRNVLAELGSNLVWDEKKLSINNAKTIDAYISGLKKAKDEKRRFELAQKSKKSSDRAVDLGDFDRSNPVCSSLCRMWDDVRTLIEGEEGLIGRSQCSNMFPS